LKRFCPFGFRGREAVENAGRNRALPSLDEINARHIRQALKMAGGKINGRVGPDKFWDFTRILSESE